MLSSIKNKTKGWVAYLIVGLITVPFALFGVNEYFTGASNVVVASVDGDEISKEAYLKEFNTTKRRLQQELGKQYTPELNQRVKLSTIDSMVNRRLLEQLADKSGYATTQQELQAFIQTNDVFKVEGKFSIDRYRQLLRLNGLSEVEYERIQADELRQSQVKTNLLDSAFVTPSMLKRIHSLSNQQRQFSYMMLDAKDYHKKAKVEPQSVQDFFDKNKQSFFEPQKVKVDFVELSTEQVAKNIKASDDDLFNLYEDEQARFSTEEERKAQHILVASKELAKTIVAQLKQGVAFAGLAAKHSQDTGSKDNDGDLGFFTLGVMVPEFEAKAFAMQEGEVSDPVKTDFGYHVIKLNKIKATETKSLETVRDELVKLYNEREVQKSIYNLTDQLSNLAYELSLEEAAEQMDLELKTSEFFTQNTKKQDAKFVAAAYSDEVLNKGENSELIELAKDKFVVLRINQKIAQKQKAFDEVKLDINKYLSSLLAKTFVEKIADEMSTSLNQGDTSAAQKTIDKYQLKWQDVGWVKRDSKQADAEVINHVFTLPKPNKNATYAARNLATQQSVVLKLSAVKTPEDAPNNVLSSVMLSFESEALFNSILKTLHKNIEIEIFADNL